MDMEDAGTRAKFVLHDRDASFTATFDSVFQTAGIRVIRSAVQAPRMNSVMNAAPLGHGPCQRAKQRLTMAIAFLAWLAGRGRQLGDCTQHDLDQWFATGPTTRRHVITFLSWARVRADIGRRAAAIGRDPGTAGNFGSERLGGPSRPCGSGSRRRRRLRIREGSVERCDLLG